MQPRNYAPVFILNDAPQQNSPPSEPVNVRNVVANVQALIDEFRIKDEHPKAIPTVTATRGGPFRASSFQGTVPRATFPRMKFC
jgi:hypothetical protein